MKISWDKLFGSNYTMDENNGIGFSILVNDDDGKGRRGWMEYGSGIGFTKNVDQFVKMQLNSADEIRLVYNGEKIECDTKPIILNDKVLVPVRAIFEKIGAKVDWDAETRTVISTYKDKSVYIKIGSNIMQVNGDNVESDVPAQIINDRTFIPVRAVCECYGCHVEWNEEIKAVIIKGNEK